MLKVTLISMPYTILTMPSLGLAQLQAPVRNKFKFLVTITLLGFVRLAQ